MTFQVYDCMADCEIGRFDTKEQAEAKVSASYGECVHVFEVEEPIEKTVKIKEKKPLEGMLF